MNEQEVKYGSPHRSYKPGFITWYEEDFRADRIVQRMTPRQRAMYRNLLMESYYGDERPYLPADDNELWWMADAESLQDWLENKDFVISKFKPMPIVEGERALLYNNRVLEEWKIIEDKLGQKRNAGLASARARRERANGCSTPVNGRSTSDDSEREPTPEAESASLREENQTIHNHTLERSTDVQRSLTDNGIEVEKTAAIDRVWNHYIGTLNKNPKLTTFTSRRKKLAMTILNEFFQRTNGDLSKAEKLMTLAVDALAASPFHCGQNEQKRRYDSWEDHLFRSLEQTEKWLERL